MINKYLVHFAGIICGAAFVCIGQIIASMSAKFAQSSLQSLFLSEMAPLSGSVNSVQPQRNFFNLENLEIEAFVSITRNATYVDLSISIFGLLILIYFSSSLFIEVLNDMNQIKNVKSKKDIKDTS